LILKPAAPNVPDDALWTQGYFISLAAVKGVVIFIFLIILLYYLKRLRGDIQRDGNIWIFNLGIILLGIYILFSPTVHPWYLCWLVPLLVVKPDRAWLLLTGLIVLSYWVLIDYSKTGVWHESIWIKYIEYLPFYTLLIYDFARNKFQNKEIARNSN